MYKITWKKEIPTIIITLGLLISAIILYPSLPDKIPLHWNIQGQIDQYGQKPSIFLIPIMTLGMAILMLYIPFIDPKKDKYQHFLPIYRMIRLSLSIFMASIYGITIFTALGYPINVSLIIPIALSIFFILLGNYMGKIRQNYFIGFRLPWTLESEEVWNKTHRFGGKLFVLIGIIGILSILLPPLMRFISLITSIFIAIGATCLYAYLTHKELEKPHKE